MIDRPTLRSILDYDPSTGLFRWRVSRPPRAVAGDVAGYNNGSGYIKISIGGERYYAHRLAFLWMTGTIPKEIDHINQCRSDNRWENLRGSNRHENIANVRGRLGIRLRYGRWYARYSNKHLGSFATRAEALSARREAEIRAAGVDPSEQRHTLVWDRDKREHKSLLHEGKSLSEWSRITGIPQPTLHHRIYVQGLTPAEAIARGRTKSSACRQSGRQDE